MKRDKKNKTQKKDVPQKRNKLDWQNFNLLENLLIFCTIPDRSAPPESGVEFRITNPDENSVCLLFEIDRKHDPLIREQSLKRPDYLSLFIQKDLILWTIIEMKGTNKNSTDRGIEQLTTFREILKNEISENLTSKFKCKIQAVLLTPYNAEIPQRAIAEEATKGFIILPLLYNSKAELYNYISRDYKKDELKNLKYNHDKMSESTNLFIEDLLTKRACNNRIQDDYYSRNYIPSKDRKGIYIDYLLPNNKDWITLFSHPDQNRRKIQLAYSNSEPQDFIEKIQEELEVLNLSQIVEMVSRLVSE